MLDHIVLYVNDFQKSKAFYSKVLQILGYKLGHEFENGAGFTDGHNLNFWITQKEHRANKFHFAFRASSRSVVDAFYKEAIDAGAEDNGPPGLRPHYHANYYGAFMLDPDGYNIEVVCHSSK